MAKEIQVVGIVSSPHREGMTARLLDAALQGAREAGASTRTVHLADETLAPCRACDGSCWETLVCARDRAGTAWHASLHAASGLVMAVPVYCWQMNALASLFIDRMRWDTGSVLRTRNTRAALGIACAGGSGTGCVLALQALYRYFNNWAFHGIPGIPVTRFSFQSALLEARGRGGELVRTLRDGLEPFTDPGAAMAHFELLPYMSFRPLDELDLIVGQLKDGLDEDTGPLADELRSRSGLAEAALSADDRAGAARHLAAAYEAGNRAWGARQQG